MFKMMASLLFFAVVFGLCIHSWREMNGMEKWRLTKLAGFSILCATFSILVLSSIVLLF